VIHHPTEPRPSGSSGASPSSTRLSGRRPVVIRAAGVAVALLGLTVLIVSVPVRFDALRSACQGLPCGEAGLGLKDVRALEELGLSTDFYAAYSVAFESGVAVVFWAVGVVIFWRNSRDKMAVFSALVLVTYGLCTWCLPWTRWQPPPRCGASPPNCCRRSACGPAS
jgi:hypothetical protein